MRRRLKIIWPRRLWQRILVGVLGVMGAIVLGLFITVALRWDRTFDYPVQDITVSMDPENIARGEYLYKTVSVCGACHSAGGEDNPDLLPTGGRSFDISSIGTIYTRNITPAVRTGIGSWTDGEIIRAIREGIGIDNRFLLFMPSELFEGMSDEDVHAIVAYLRSLEPVENEVPETEVNMIGKVLLSFISPPHRIISPVTAPPRGPTAEYGEYLVNHVSLCAACHTPRVRGQIDRDRLWSGGRAFDEGENTIYSANLTPDVETGIGTWTEEDFFRTIRTGVHHDEELRLPMPWRQLRNMTDDDLKAIWLHIQSVKPIRYEVPENIIVEE